MFYTECTLKVFFLCCIQISTSANGHRTFSCAVHGQILWWERAGDTTKTCPVDLRIFSSQARAPVKNIMAMYRERTLLGRIKLKRSSAASREESVKHTRLPQKKFKQRPGRRQRQQQKKSNRFRLAKQELCTWCTTLFFLYINLFAVTARLCEVKVPNFTFCGGLEQKTTIFFFFPWTLMQSFRIQPYWIVLKRKCFFCDARKREKLTHTHTTTFKCCLRRE